MARRQIYLTGVIVTNIWEQIAYILEKNILRRLGDFLQNSKLNQQIPLY